MGRNPDDSLVNSAVLIPSLELTSIRYTIGLFLLICIIASWFVILLSKWILSVIISWWFGSKKDILSFLAHQVPIQSFVYPMIHKNLMHRRERRDKLQYIIKTFHGYIWLYNKYATIRYVFQNKYMYALLQKQERMKAGKKRVKRNVLLSQPFLFLVERRNKEPH